MKKQLYLNLSYSKWIWYLVSVSLLKSVDRFWPVICVNLQPLIQFLTVLNVVGIVFTISSVQN